MSHNTGIQENRISLLNYIRWSELYMLQQIYKYITSNSKLIAAITSAVIIMIALVISSFKVTDDTKDGFINLSLLGLGWSVGWLIGTLLSPYTGTEQTKFAEYAGAVSVFVSGYLIGKIDGLITNIFNPTTLFSISKITGFRIIAFLAASVVTMITTYVFRSYGH
jgi:hypothetical protein